jgi:hypothetical protein
MTTQVVGEDGDSSRFSAVTTHISHCGQFRVYFAKYVWYHRRQGDRQTVVRYWLSGTARKA